MTVPGTVMIKHRHVPHTELAGNEIPASIVASGTRERGGDVHRLRLTTTNAEGVALIRSVSGF